MAQPGPDGESGHGLMPTWPWVGAGSKQATGERGCGLGPTGHTGLGGWEFGRREGGYINGHCPPHQISGPCGRLSGQVQWLSVPHLTALSVIANAESQMYLL